MIAIFTVLGLLLFGGGGYAIYDGWPYLVLERGFTQVIIGSIASSAGLIMLSLAWVLKEIRGIRRALVEAIALRTQAPLPAAVPEQAPFAAPARPEAPAFVPPVAPAAIGAVAGAAATSAVAQALAATDDEKAPAPAAEAASPGERDLFGALVAQKLDEPEPAAEDESDAVAEPAVESTEPLPDMFGEASLPPPELVAPAVTVEAEGHEPAELVAAKVQPSIEEESVVERDEPEPSDIVSSSEPSPEEPSIAPVEAPKTPADAAEELDEFSALRASLAGHLNEPEPETGRIEPSFAPEPDPFAAAETWMDRAAPRREPWLGTPPAEEPAPAEDAAPLWPPRTEPQAFEAPAEPAAVDAEPEVLAGPADLPAPQEPDEAPSADLPEAAAIDENPAEQAPAAAESRPASDEGIVGAYQVGDAHFTIYADGSIRARTPDGEYSFASMDELKIYLASEKSRLGV
ncbi:hypothetical protein [Bosea sp. ANAM02]|uniref:hypothetical protein n=1 Tax=Bosea sp. ANAM02 TaxID=2020412 RepID=UPI00140ECFE0|nr:hypothetical protein [Bosea sp. ANAM02]BCB20749.1 hypothetical protein OCUBac02_36430 [Bosea sp. ANAM02]